MTQQQVQQIGPTIRTPAQKEKKGGGKFGQVLGGIAGAVVGGVAAGTVTGGAATGWGAAKGAMLGAAGGASLGGLVGESVSPSRAGSEAMTRRLDSQGPQITHSEQSESLKQSLLSLKSQPPNLQQEYQAPLVQAYIASLARDNPKPTGVA